MASSPRGTESGLFTALERVWSGWRGKPRSHGLVDHKFILDMPVQQHWDWRVAFYLYLAATSGGFIFLEVMLQGMDVITDKTATWGMWIGLGLALLSLMVLFDHLGPVARWKFYYAFRRPRTSWIARGAIIVTMLVILRIVVLLPEISGLEGLPWERGSVAGNVLRGAVMVLALAFMAYSGLVLSSWNAIAFWNTPLLPALYIGYSFLGGVAAVPILTWAVEGRAAMETLGSDLWPYLLGLLLGNGALLLLYVWGMATATVPARESVRRLLHGGVGWSFWIGAVGIGLLFPTAIVALAVGEVMERGAAAATLFTAAGVAVLLGGFLLRDNVLRVGVYGPPV